MLKLGLKTAQVMAADPGRDLGIEPRTISMDFVSLFITIPRLCGSQLQHPDAGILLRLLLLAPLLEEWIIRAGLQEWTIGRSEHYRLEVQAAAVPTGLPAILSTLLPILAPVLLSATGFSLLHLSAGLFMAGMVFVPGLVLALVYQATRDWRLCALVHSFFNAFALCFCGF
ncbi:JDVT-CTERM system glutamic-type intramembrane protease [Undibacterium terreum]|uniref:CAAX prenyl protease 2/Lysostaphin resistance protein A-like domain-containing protein n=1 Tax=Undibacterium terreum TaxID=1224302 RepID=A0A916V0W9_9BURK|nr:JDVT-CTERM system glutamic-type intramembrane protease [Undibacterium terreum]GGD00390.1 hypothetical protein GCM10011396_54910 [Undibacterium terreum]